MSAVNELFSRVRHAAWQLSVVGQAKLGVELAEQVGLARQEIARGVEVDVERWRKLAAYHQKRAHDCGGAAREFHLDAVKLLRGES